MDFWFLQFLPKNERKQVDLRYHSSKVEFVCSFFGGNVILKKSFQICLTFRAELFLRLVENKVQTLWEGHKIWKILPLVLTKQLFLLSSIKTSGRFSQIFVTSSEKLDFLVFSVSSKKRTKKVDYHSSQVESIRSFFGGNVILKK